MLCKYHTATANPKLTQIQLLTWLQEAHNADVCRDTVSNTLEQKAELIDLGLVDCPMSLTVCFDANANSKRHRAVKYHLMEAGIAD